MSDDDDLLDALSGRLAPPPAVARGGGFTRRSIVAGLGLGLGAMSGLPRRSWAGPFVPIVQATPRGVTLRFQGLRWDLERSALGRTARFRVQQDSGRILIRAARAVLPGTDLRADFTLALANDRGRWRCQLAIASFDFTAERDLATFLAGQPLTGRCRALGWSTASGSVWTAAGSLAVRCSPSLQFAFDAAARVDGQVQARGARLTLDIRNRRQSLAGWLGATADPYFTAFELAQPVMRAKTFACANGTHSVAVRHAAPDAIDGEFVDTLLGRAQLAVLTGQANLDIIRDGAVEPLLVFDRVATLVAADRVAVSGTLSDEPFRIGLAHAAAEIRGRANQRAFRTVLRPGARNAIAADVDVEALLLPLADGDHARVVAGGRAATVFGAGPAAAKAPALAIEGGDDSALVLKDNDIRLRRGADLLDLHFIFSGFELRQYTFGGAYLKRLRDGKVCRPATITLALPHQHLGENAIEVADFDCPMPPKLKTFLAQPSRIVFKLPPQTLRDAVWEHVDVSIASLTTWDAIEPYLSLAPRARAGDTLESQLHEASLDAAQSSNLAAYLARIEDTLLLPKPDETSLELADKLIFSPGPGTKWEFPGHAPDTGKPMFGIRIGHRSDPRLRALWSRRLDEQTLPSDITKDELLKRAWGIVAQTSIYGLPALRRIAPNDGTPDVPEALTKVPRGGIVRPDPAPPYLLEIDRLLEDHRPKLPSEQPPAAIPPESGIALATTFDVADVTMTSLGATMRIDWRGEPPIYEPTPALTDPATNLPRAVRPTALERLFYSTWLGRDEVVIAANKGFLLPIGFRATLLHTQKRAYVPDPGRSGHTVAIDVVRTRIVTRQPVKSFPALNQPDGGRDWPISQATLRTDATPLLIDPATLPPDELAAIVAKHNLGNWQIFWPRFHTDAATVADVEWKVQVESDVTPMTARMIFIDSETVPIDTIVAEVVAAYNRYTTNDWPASRTARLNGARRRYADAKKPEDTSFDTDSWLLAARGRSLGDTEYFFMDARMNGADQPPFYPSVRRTKIAVQSIDRLVGTPQGLIECQPDPIYVRNGFTGVNDPEIFLDVVRPEIAFNVVGVPGASMGVAAPITLVAALARSGIVGGTNKTSGNAPAMFADSQTSDLQLNFDQARQNKFSITEFMPKLKILGIDFARKFADVVLESLDAGPKLLETYQYGVEQAENALTAIKTIARDALPPVNEAFGKCAKGGQICGIDLAIKAVNDKLQGTGLTFETLYPDFVKAYRTAQGTVPAALQEVDDATSLDGVAKGASDMIVAVKPFVAAIETLVENPVPQVFEMAIGELAKTWATLQDGARTELRRFFEQTVVSLVRDLVVAIFSQATADELELALGVDVDPATIELFLLDPSARPQIEQAFLYDRLGAPLARLADILSELVQGFEGRVLLERKRLLASLTTILARAERMIDARLDRAVAGSIAEPAVQAKLAADSLRIVDAALAALQPNPAAGDPLDTQLAKLRGRMADSVRASLRAAVEDPRLFPPMANDTAEAIARDFAAAIGDALTQAVADASAAAAERARDLLRQYAGAVDRQVARIAALIVSVVANTVRLGGLPRLARAAAAIADWCTGAQTVVAAGVAFADGLLGDALGIEQRLVDLVQKAALVSGPTQPPQAVQAFEAARKELLAAARDLMAVAATLKQARADVRRLQKGDACRDPVRFSRAVEAAMRTRNEAVVPLVAILTATDKMRRAVYGSPPHLRPGMLATAPTILDIHALGRELLLDLTTIGKAGGAADWPAVTAAIADLKTHVAGFGDLMTSIDDEVKSITTKASAARAAIAAADPAALAAIAQDLARDYPFLDLRLAGLILQTIAFTATSLKRLEDAELAALKAAAAGLAGFEHAIAKIGFAITDKVEQNDVLRYLLALAGAENMREASKRLDDEAHLLDTVAGVSTADDAIRIVGPIVDSWNGGHAPLVDLFHQLVLMVDMIFQGNISKLIGDEVRRLATALQAQLADIIKRFVPTSVSTSFDWSTKIESDDIFAMIALPEDQGDHDLTLSSLVSYDFVNNRSTVAVRGYLKSFSVTLPHMARISFLPVEFTSGTGQQARFEVHVHNVELLDYLAFLDALSSWMKPKGNGFYIVPTFDNIKVGYQFSSDLIMVGDLEFINIAIEVFAQLPFGDGSVVFGFDFASEEKPFIIAAAPYGGGGYLQVRTDADGAITDLTLSFLFGAVVAFQFSFLSGTGRIFAGVALTLKKRPGVRDGLTVQAIVEAVGEGHIACFSLTIFIRIVCTHTEDGDLDGSATYRFSFKVGFFSVHYQVTAKRHIAGSKKQKDPKQPAVAGRYRPALAGGGAPRRPPHFTISTSAPLKSRHWDDYRNHVALDLIDDCW